MEFLNIPDAYYEQLRKRLARSKVKVVEDIAELQKLKILIDYDDSGYLLQVRRCQAHFKNVDRFRESPSICPPPDLHEAAAGQTDGVH